MPADVGQRGRFAGAGTPNQQVIIDLKPTCTVEACGDGRYFGVMIPPPETIKVKTLRVACDGSGEVPAALGHPRVYLHIDDQLGFVDCGYCDRRFLLEGGPADRTATGA